MRRFKRLIVLLLLCVCCVLPLAACTSCKEDKWNNLVDSYELEDDKLTIYFNNKITSPYDFYYLATLKSDYNTYQSDSLEELLSNEDFISYGAGLSNNRYSKMYHAWTVTVNNKTYTQVYLSKFSKNIDYIDCILLYHTDQHIEPDYTASNYFDCIKLHEKNS